MGNRVAKRRIFGASLTYFMAEMYINTNGSNFINLFFQTNPHASDFPQIDEVFLRKLVYLEQRSQKNPASQRRKENELGNTRLYL